MRIADCGLAVAEIAERVERGEPSPLCFLVTQSGEGSPRSTRSAISATANPQSAIRNQPRLFSVRNDMASMRVRSSFLKTPRTAEVIVVAPAFLTPRIVMHRWIASITTITPFG